MKKLKLIVIIAMVSFIFFAGCKKDEYVAKVGVCPLVISTDPANNAMGVPLNKIITATFNEKMNPATFTQASFTIQGATAIAGTVSFRDSTATFTPSAPLLPNTTYTGTIKASVRDLMGNYLQEDYIWTFNTDVSPMVISTSPANNETAVVLNKIITATFNVQMDPLSLTSTTFIIKQGTTTVTGTISYNGTTASFTPTIALTPNTVYTGTITTGAKNVAGTPMANNYVWTFTTDLVPTVISTDPANNAIGVVLDKTVTATFSVPMDALTITSATFTLKQGTTSIAGVISYSGSTASFKPSSPLTPNTIYTGTITTGAKNVGGTPIADNYVWTFSTGVSPTVISTDPANNAIGVALDKTVTATFSVPMDPLTITSATFTLKQGTTSIAGVVSYSGSTASFNPTGSLTPNTIYTGTITTGAKNLEGIPLADNYVWTFTTGLSPTVISTDPANNATGVTLDKTVTATFSVPMNPLTITSATFTLKQGTTIVAGVVSYSGSTASFNPTGSLTPNTIYTGTITTGAMNVGGIPLANNYVWTFTTGISPMVISTDPLNNATNVALDKTVAATFSVPMDPLTITSATFTLKQGTTSILGVVSYSGSTAFFNPTVDLLPGLLYTATITTGAKNAGGIPLVNNYVWTFTTALAIPPTVISTDPLNNAINVVLNKTVAATFSVPMNPLTITSATFTLKQGTTSIAGVVSYSGTTAFFNPTDNLLPDLVYTATITTGAKNIAGTALVNNYVWTFTTSPIIIIAPEVIFTDPANNDIDVILEKTVLANFSMPMDPLTITSSTFTLKQGTTPVAGVVFYNGSYVSFNPSSNLLAGTTYTATITTGAKNVAGTPLIANYVWTFTTLTQYTLNVNAVNGSVMKTPNLSGYNIGATVQLTATPNPGYSFTSWSGDATGSDNPLTVTMDENKYITANFTLNTYTLNVTAVNGTVTKNPDQLTYDHGDIVELTATADPGFVFDSWSGDAIGILNPKQILMNANKNITANFIASAVVCVPAVDLGLSGNYVILAESGISTAGATSVTGDMGISPAAATLITGFSLILPAGGAFSTSIYVTGNVYAPGYAAPTPANLTTAINNMHTAYTTANGLVVPAPVNEFMAGNLNGQTLTAGIYKWSSGVLITNGITLDGGGDDCAQFILQIAQDLTVANSAIITLQNGAQAKNIFWVVAGSGAVLGTNVNFKGNILSKTLISVNTGGTVSGRLLAQTAVTLGLNTVVVFPY